MKKVGTFLLAIIFSAALFTGCADAQADEVYDHVVPEKTNKGDNSAHQGGPGGG